MTQQEVDRAISQITAQTAFDRDGSFSIASEINEAIAMGDWTFYVRYPQEVRKVTPERVKEVANRYFLKDKSTTGYFVPKRPGGDSDTPASRPRSDQEFESRLYYRDHEFEAVGSGSMQGDNVAEAQETNLADKIRKTEIGDIEVYSMTTGVNDVVTITGSLAGGDWYSPSSNSMIADMTGNMLDKGTRSKDKFQIAEELENLGASIDFSVDAHALTFDAQCLRKDIPTVMALLAEQLMEPSFSAEELEKLKIQRKGSFQRSMESTNFMASSKLNQLIYPESHPNYQTPVEQLLQDIDKVTVEDLKAFHEKYYGPRSLKIVAVGDLDSQTVEEEVRNAFNEWSGGITYREAASAPSSEKRDELVYMEDKTSVTVNMGIPLGIDEDHADYMPLMLGTYVLGGNFSARLMSTVRDKEGLTYGIRSHLSGTELSDGHWRLVATFAPDLLDRGMTSTMREVEDWFENGITAEELKAKKSTITGSTKVQLATTGGLANYIHDFAQRGKPVSYADRYFEEIEALTLDRVNRTIQKYIDPDKLVVVKAGTVENQGSN